MNRLVVSICMLSGLLGCYDVPKVLKPSKGYHAKNIQINPPVFTVSQGGLLIEQRQLESLDNVLALLQQARKYSVNKFIVQLDNITAAVEKNLLFLRNEGKNLQINISFIENNILNLLDLHTSPSEQWMQCYHLIETAIHLGAQQIFLTYHPQKQLQSQDIAKRVDIIKKWYTIHNNSNIPLHIKVS